jgi:tetratricopeptide (TPR) repeat protein
LSNEAVIAILIFILVVVVFVCLRYDTEVRALFGRLERFRADRRGIESTFTPAPAQAATAAGGSAAPEPEEPESGLEVDGSDTESGDGVDLEAETSTDSVHRRMVVAALAGDVDLAQQARRRFHEISEDEVEVARADALLDALNFNKSGKPEDFKSLRARADDERITAFVERLTGMVLENLKRSSEAADAYARAAASATTPSVRAEMIAKRAKMLGNLRQAEKAEGEVKNALRDESDPEARATLWRALASTYAARGIRLDQAIALQEARAYEPNDSDLCFQIAWALGSPTAPTCVLLPSTSIGWPSTWTRRTSSR